MAAPLASNATAAMANRTLNSTINGTMDAEYDRIDPRYAVVLMYLLLILLVGAQTALFAWKKHHQRSYDLATLTGLWIVPPIIAVQLRFWTFLGAWAAFSAVTGYFFWVCWSKRADYTTPRKVYAWFLGLHKVSVAVGVAGYVMLIAEMFGAGVLLALLLPRGAALVLLWYGLYFGILGRDCAEVASDRMALALSGKRRLASSANSCGMCGGELKDFSHMGEQSEGVERCVQLSCKHCFHELCIRGWTVVGKKEVCPACNEKVDLKGLYADRPWETSNLQWIQMLDAIRYMVVWNPMVFMVFSLISHFFPHIHGHHPHLQGAGAMIPPPPSLALRPALL